MIGDPGSAKTRILQSVSTLVPKGIYVSGKSVTGGRHDCGGGEGRILRNTAGP